jgi:hypothetical protein
MKENAIYILGVCKNEIKEVISTLNFMSLSETEKYRQLANRLTDILFENVNNPKVQAIMTSTKSTAVINLAVSAIIAKLYARDEELVPEFEEAVGNIVSK